MGHHLVDYHHRPWPFSLSAPLQWHNNAQEEVQKFCEKFATWLMCVGFCLEISRISMKIHQRCWHRLNGFYHVSAPSSQAGKRLQNYAQFVYVLISSSIDEFLLFSSSCFFRGHGLEPLEPPTLLWSPIVAIQDVPLLHNTSPMFFFQCCLCLPESESILVGN